MAFPPLTKQGEKGGREAAALYGTQEGRGKRREGGKANWPGTRTNLYN